MKPLIVAMTWICITSPAFADQAIDLFQSKEDHWSSALARHDISALVADYEANALLVLPGLPPVSGREAIATALTHVDQSTAKLELRTVTCMPLGTGYYVENGVATVQPVGSNPISTLNYQVIWHLESNEWHIVRDIVAPQ